MIFNFTFGIQKAEQYNLKVNTREAIRAVIVKDDMVLMILTNRGDYKFPGGGVNKQETHEETLKREVMEEAGYIIKNVNDYLGQVIERRPDEYESNSIFQMTSHYYLCEVCSERTNQQLDSYEAELDFYPVWVHIDEVIERNENIIHMDEINKNPWVYRETEVLKALRKESL